LEIARRLVGARLLCRGQDSDESRHETPRAEQLSGERAVRWVVWNVADTNAVPLRPPRCGADGLPRRLVNTRVLVKRDWPNEQSM